MIEITKTHTNRTRGRVLARAKNVDGFNWCGHRMGPPRLTVTAHSEDMRHKFAAIITGADLVAIYGWLRDVYGNQSEM